MKRTKKKILSSQTDVAGGHCWMTREVIHSAIFLQSIFLNLELQFLEYFLEMLTIY